MVYGYDGYGIYGFTEWFFPAKYWKYYEFNHIILYHDKVR